MRKISGQAPEKSPSFSWEVNTMDISLSSPVLSPHIANVSEKVKNISGGKAPRILTYQCFHAFPKNSLLENLHDSHPAAS